MAVLLILALIMMIVFCLLFLKITAEVAIDKENGRKTNTDFKFEIAGARIDIAKFLNKKPSSDLAELESNSEKAADDAVRDSFAERLIKLRVNIARGKYTYLLSKRYVRKKITINNLDVSVVFGLGDAAQTGVATGAVWSGIYCVFAFLDSLTVVESHDFSVTPVFEASGIAYKFKMKAQCRIKDIIAIAFAVILNYLKTGKNL